MLFGVCSKTLFKGRPVSKPVKNLDSIEAGMIKAYDVVVS